VRPPSAREAARLPGLVYDTTFRGDGTLSLPERPSTSYSSVREVVQVIDDRILTFDPAEPDQAKAFVERGFLPPGSKRYKDRRFMFDRVFRPDSSQQEVYDATSRPLLQRLLDGFNTTVFAYGVSLVFDATVPGTLNFVALLQRQQAVERLILSVEQIPTQGSSI
jgi:kinesin family protein 18/19